MDKRSDCFLLGSPIRNWIMDDPDPDLAIVLKIQEYLFTHLLDCPLVVSSRILWKFDTNALCSSGRVSLCKILISTYLI